MLRKIDMANAINNCGRHSFLNQLQKELLELYSWVLWCYHTIGELRFENCRLTSSAGVQQGDPLGPLLFSLVVMELMDELGPTPGIALQLWYLDDGIFIGICPEVASLLRKLQSAGTSFGLQLNAAKCKVFWPSGDQSFLEISSDVQRVDANKDGAEFLGSPVCGSKEFVDNSLAKRVDRDLECQQLLSDLGNSQVELHLLRSCLSLCKINHLISTVPSDVNRKSTIQI